jgi:hypothetical protein
MRTLLATTALAFGVAGMAAADVDDRTVMVSVEGTEIEVPVQQAMDACPDVAMDAMEADEVACEIDQMTADMHDIVVEDEAEMGDEVADEIDDEMLEETDLADDTEGDDDDEAEE